MKYSIFFLIFVLMGCGTLINPVYNKLPEDKKVIYKPDSEVKINLASNDEKGKVYTINKKQLENLIKNSTVDFHLVILYAVWCSPCRKELPTILNYFQSKKKVKLYFITSDDWHYTNNVRNYWKKTDFNEATYILDIYEYQHTNSLHAGINERNKVFLNSLCENCVELGGYPTFILFNKKFEVIYKKAGVIENFNQKFDIFLK